VFCEPLPPLDEFFEPLPHKPHTFGFAVFFLVGLTGAKKHTHTTRKKVFKGASALAKPLKIFFSCGKLAFLGLSRFNKIQVALPEKGAKYLFQVYVGDRHLLRPGTQ
jgi:hypothetical protein